MRPIRRALAALGAAALAIAPSAAFGQAGAEVKLPTPLDAIAVVPGADDILTGAGFEERTFPGRVDDRESVLVDLAPGGAPASIRVEHRLTLHGLGDYSFRIPGPVGALEALPESESRPGLRRGSIIWQGFSPGRRELAATFFMDPLVEQRRLPVRVTVRGTAGGEPFDPARPMRGVVDLEIVLQNASPFPTRIADADADPRVVAAALDAMHADLAAGRRPAGGRRGVPKTVPALERLEDRSEAIEAPMAVAGFLGFGPCEGDLRAGGARVQNERGPLFGFNRLLGGGRPLTHRIRVTGTVRECEFGSLWFSVAPAAPRAEVVAPPAPAGSWEEAVGRGIATDGRAMLARAMTTMWQVARLRLYDAYVGNPDATGLAHTSFRYELKPAVATPAVVPPPVRTLGAFGAAIAAVAGVALLFSAGLLWANS